MFQEMLKLICGDLSAWVNCVADAPVQSRSTQCKQMWKVQGALKPRLLGDKKNALSCSTIQSWLTFAHTWALAIYIERFFPLLHSELWFICSWNAYWLVYRFDYCQVIIPFYLLCSFSVLFVLSCVCRARRFETIFFCLVNRCMLNDEGSIMVWGGDCSAPKKDFIVFHFISFQFCTSYILLVL